MIFNSATIAAMPSRTRAAFINSLTGFKPANLIGTSSRDGNVNLAIMSSVVHLGSHPPLFALIIRPGGEERHTLSNILETGLFSINHVNSSIIDAAHQTAARYPREVSEFTATGLSPEWHNGFEAPLVSEASIKLGLQLRDHQQLAINDTHLVIGEIVIASVPEAHISREGAADLAAADTVALTGLDTYHSALPLKRMAYAKPDQPPTVLAFNEDYSPR